MAWTARFLLPIRQSFSQSQQLFHGKIGPLRRLAESVEPKLQNMASRFDYNLNIQRKYVRDFFFSGSRNTRSIFGVSVVFGAVYCWPRFTYAMDGLHFFVDGLESFDASEGEDDRHKLWMLMRKLWLPVFFVFTVLVNWDNPFSVAIRIILFLLSTKPSPSSIYLFVERLCHKYMRQKPHLYIFKLTTIVLVASLLGWTLLTYSYKDKRNIHSNERLVWNLFLSLHASKVEVQDYKLICLARVEIGDQKLHLIGILGGWWSLPSSLGMYILPCSGAAL